MCDLGTNDCIEVFTIFPRRKRVNSVDKISYIWMESVFNCFDFGKNTCMLVPTFWLDQMKSFRYVVVVSNILVHYKKNSHGLNKISWACRQTCFNLLNEWSCTKIYTIGRVDDCSDNWRTIHIDWDHVVGLRNVPLINSKELWIEPWTFQPSLPSSIMKTFLQDFLEILNIQTRL